MNPIRWMLLAGLTAVAAHAAAPSQEDTRFDSFGSDYKRGQVLPETFFNPFKVRFESGLAKREGPGATAESLAEAITRRGVSGLAASPGGGPGRVIIGDQVFCVGDELGFPDADKPGLAPLLAGSTVILRAADAHKLVFEVSADGDAPRRVNFPLADFWKQ
jgi:hypothetical protein